MLLLRREVAQEEEFGSSQVPKSSSRQAHAPVARVSEPLPASCSFPRPTAVEMASEGTGLKPRANQPAEDPRETHKLFKASDASVILVSSE
mgnify:CR=1 FL=1